MSMAHVSFKEVIRSSFQQIAIVNLNFEKAWILQADYSISKIL